MLAAPPGAGWHAGLRDRLRDHLDRPEVTATLTELLRAGLPALAFLAVALGVIRVVCRRPLLRRLSLALAVAALAAAGTLFALLAPRLAPALAPYVRFLALFAGAYLALRVAELFWAEILPARRGQVPPPAILRDIVAAVVAGLIVVVLLRSTFGVDVTALVATSAAVSIVLGLALQETLSNLFAGLALTLDRPFVAGDWIRIGDRIGRVNEISWRAVKIQIIRQEDYLIIPNSVVAKSEVVNMSRPTPIHGHSVEIGVAYDEAPNRVRAVVLEAALEVGGVLRDPMPRVELARFDASAMVYRLTFWIADFPHWAEIEGQVLSHVWYAFRRSGISIPFPVSDVRWHDAARVAEERRQAEQVRHEHLLDGVDFLEPLVPAQRARLAAEAHLAPYPRGVAVVRQGEVGDSLFVIAEGRVEILAESHDGRPGRPLAEMGPGEYFGEMSLLTGARRSATVRALQDTQLLVLGAEALRPVLVGDPGVAERLSRTLISRQAEHEGTLARPAPGPATSALADEANPLLGAILRFFGLGGATG